MCSSGVMSLCLALILVTAQAHEAKDVKAHNVEVSQTGRPVARRTQQRLSQKTLTGIAMIENSQRYKKPTSATRRANIARSFSASAIEATSVLSTKQTVTSGTNAAARAASLIEGSTKFNKATMARSTDHMSALEAASYTNSATASDDDDATLQAAKLENAGQDSPYKYKLNEHFKAASVLSADQAAKGGAALAASMIERSPKYTKATAARSSQHMSALESASYITGASYTKEHTSAAAYASQIEHSDQYKKGTAEGALERSALQATKDKAASAVAAIEHSPDFNKASASEDKLMAEQMDVLEDAYSKSAVEDSSKYNKPTNAHEAAFAGSTFQVANSAAAAAAFAIERSANFKKSTHARSSKHMSALVDAYFKSSVEDSSKYNKAAGFEKQGSAAAYADKIEHSSRFNKATEDVAKATANIESLEDRFEQRALDTEAADADEDEDLIGPQTTGKPRDNGAPLCSAYTCKEPKKLISKANTKQGADDATCCYEPQKEVEVESSARQSVVSAVLAFAIAVAALGNTL